jgi:CRP-like cAMP-binding protein
MTDITKKEKTINFLKNADLFKGLSAQQLGIIASEIEEIKVNEKEVIIHEDDLSDKIYLIKEGKVEVTKFDPKLHRNYHLTFLGEGAVFGELPLIDNAPRSATVRALKPTVLYVLSIAKLPSLDDRKIKNSNSLSLPMSIYPTIVKNVATYLSQRLRSTNVLVMDAIRKDLLQTKARAYTGELIIFTLFLLSFYMFTTRLVARIYPEILSSTLISVSLMVIFVIALGHMAKHSGHSKEFFGISLKNWRPAVVESLIFTVPLLLAIIVYKWLLLELSPAFANRHLFDLSVQVSKTAQHTPPAIKALLVMLYMIFVPVQELIIRGILQSSFYFILVGPHKMFWAILLSNLLFSDIHVHFSLEVGLIVLIPGFFWGWLYARQKTLIGVIVSHLIAGVWALYIVGLVPR